MVNTVSDGREVVPVVHIGGTRLPRRSCGKRCEAREVLADQEKPTDRECSNGRDTGPIDRQIDRSGRGEQLYRERNVRRLRDKPARRHQSPAQCAAGCFFDLGDETLGKAFYFSLGQGVILRLQADGDRQRLFAVR